MSRRRTPRKPANSQVPNDGTAWGHLSDAQLFAELARRQVAKGTTLEAIELASKEGGRVASEEIQAAKIAALPPEDGKPKSFPMCLPARAAFAQFGRPSQSFLPALTFKSRMRHAAQRATTGVTDRRTSG
jgi:hypothetical protein